MKAAPQYSFRVPALIGIILAAALMRLIPHPPNFTPMTAIALFGGAYFTDKRLAFLLPLGALFISDWVMGFYSLMPLVYGCFALFVCFGLWLQKRRTLVPIAGSVLASSILFFVITNFGVWAWENLYPKTPAGLLACYAAGLPFFRYTLLGDILFSTALFGGFALVEKWFPRLREYPAASAIA